jgi:hypothetical protein
MVHKSKVEKYSGSMEELAEEIGNLKYDALSDFLELLANKIQEDGRKYEARNRTKLSRNLYENANKIKESKGFIDEAWRISKPFMD